MTTFTVIPHLSARLAQGPLSGVVPRYQLHLFEQGYTARTSECHLCLLANLNEWLERHDLRATDLTETTINRYLQYRHVHFRTLRDDRSIFRKILRLLQDAGVLKAKDPPSPCNPHQHEEEEYDRYLIEERGLAMATRVNYRPFIHRFLSVQFGSKPARPIILRAKDIVQFVQYEAPRHSPKRAGLMITALRSFLRYLRFRGAIATDLASCVPSIANWQLASLPRFLQAHQVRQVLQVCDRRTSHGRRDYAILLLLARLGLRACEVVSLTLDDINWRSGEITIRGKGNRSTRLPLPPDVGHAIAAYLKKGRPPCPSRRVFLCLRAPRRAFANSIAISTIVARRLRSAGIEAPHMGAHLFRHTLATHMLRKGASFAEIAHLLRHRSFNTTAIYAKVDLSALRGLAQPWPEGGAQ
jgi:site-specific recombinase XerD